MSDGLHRASRKLVVGLFAGVVWCLAAGDASAAMQATDTKDAATRSGKPETVAPLQRLAGPGAVRTAPGGGGDVPAAGGNIPQGPALGGPVPLIPNQRDMLPVPPAGQDTKPARQQTKVPQEKSTPKGVSGATPRRTATPTPAAAVPAGRQISNEVLVLLADGQPPGVDVALSQQYGLVPLEQLPIALLAGRVHRYRIAGSGNVDGVVAALSADPRVEVAQPHFAYDAQQSTSGPASDPQYALAMISAAPAHKIAQGRNVTVAVIDTGVDAAHPVLAEAVAQTYNAVQDGAYVAATHGTSVAGVIAGRGEMSGVAPRARLLAVQAFYFNNDRKQMESSSLILLRGIDWAFANGARIFNLSFAGFPDPLVRTLLNVTEHNGAVHIAAAGNNGPKAGPAYPGAYKSVIAVTAIDSKGRLLAEANRGDYVELSAPGVDILVPVVGGKLGLSSGTSVAAAHVSGLVALLREANPTISVADVRRILTSTAHDLGPKGRDRLYGAGRVNALASLRRANGLQ